MRNCLTYAVGMWFRHGGYLLVRRSKLAAEFGITSPWHPAYWVPHFLHRTPDHVITQYTATDEQRRRNKARGLLRAWLGLWNFDGEVIGDDLQKEDR